MESGVNVFLVDILKITFVSCLFGFLVLAVTKRCFDHPVHGLETGFRI